jgi:hypothetical protein
MFDPNLPTTRARIVSAELRDQFNGLKALIDALQAQVNNLLPVGFIGAWPKSRANIPALPGSWVECNGQVLNDPDSPFHGQTMDDLNGVSGPQRFLRGASASGGTGGADTMNLAGEVTVDNNQDASTTTVASAPQPDLPILPSYFEVVWVMRVK